MCLTDVVHVSMSGEERPQLTQLLEAAQRRTITSLGNQRRNKVRDWLFGYSVGRSISIRNNRSVYLHQTHSFHFHLCLRPRVIRTFVWRIHVLAGLSCAGADGGACGAVEPVAGHEHVGQAAHGALRRQQGDQVPINRS